MGDADLKQKILDIARGVGVGAFDFVGADNARARIASTGRPVAWFRWASLALLPT
jgi:hypothetical protein